MKTVRIINAAFLGSSSDCLVYRSDRRMDKASMSRTECCYLLRLLLCK